MAKTAEKAKESSVEEKLKALYHLQQIDTKIDKIRTKDVAIQSNCLPAL